MSGENSKNSGEIGEKIASTLLEKVGWKHRFKIFLSAAIIVII